MSRLYKIILFYVLLITFYATFGSPIFASKSNIFGLHLTQTSDILSAKDVINSAGGDWGWVTIVIRSDQLDARTWQDFFDNCRKYHLIPIVRLATIMDGEIWKHPSRDNIDQFVSFLSSLNWPTQQQHIILFNEINHGREWGGGVDIKDYADLALYAADKFKTANPNFFILGSALDLASPENPPEFKSAANVYREIYLYKPEYFQSLDGLASHSYPNHGYVGKPNETGQHSVRGYQWELATIKSLGIQKSFPVFITETGWPHREGEVTDNQFYTVQTSAKFLGQTLENWIQDDRVVAVTPFIYNYPYSPFDHFSWLTKDGQLYPEYQQVVNLPKAKSTPEQITRYEVEAIHLPILIITNQEYLGEIKLKNTGQSIWGETNFCLTPQTTQNVVADAICTTTPSVPPGHTENFPFKFHLTAADRHDKTFLSWQNLPPFEIKPLILGNSILYHPQTNFFETIQAFFQRLL